MGANSVVRGPLCVCVCALIDCQQSTSLPRRVDPLEKRIEDGERRVEIDDMARASTATSGFIDRPSDAPRASFPPFTSHQASCLRLYTFILSFFIHLPHAPPLLLGGAIFVRLFRHRQQLSRRCVITRAPGRSRVQLSMTPFFL